MKSFLSALLSVALLIAQTPSKNVHSHTIYIPMLHSYSGPDNRDFDALVRSKLISSMVQYCESKCTVLEENPDEDADYILTGSVWLQQTDEFHKRVQGSMRLVSRNGKVIWAATLYSSAFGRSATSSFADKTAKKAVAFLSGNGKSETQN